MKYLLRWFESLCLLSFVSTAAGDPLPAQSPVEKEHFSLILPHDLYIKADRNYNLYFKQAIKTESSKFWRLVVCPNLFQYSERQLFRSGKAELPKNKNVNVEFKIYDDCGRAGDGSTHTVHLVQNPASPQEVRILNCGDSISDLGHYQLNLYRFLQEDQIASVWLGTMAHMRKNKAITIDGEICNEVLSGGNLSFLTQPVGPGVLLHVEGLAVFPHTRYPGTLYEDFQGQQWCVRGADLTLDATGKYSGLLRLGIFKADPNYEKKEASDPAAVKWGGPQKGMLKKSIKSAKYDGDEIIHYSAWEKAYFNPFWNPETQALDFRYYIEKFHFAPPDILLMQWGYNEVGGFAENDSNAVQIAVARAKTVIDRFHRDFPDAKVVFGIECYGSEVIRYALPKKYSILSLAEKLIGTFEAPEYKEFVYLVPVYAQFDAVRGFGSPVEVERKWSIYPGEKVKIIPGSDGVHPPYFSCPEISLAYEAVICHILNERAAHQQAVGK